MFFENLDNTEITQNHGFFTGFHGEITGFSRSFHGFRFDHIFSSSSVKIVNFTTHSELSQMNWYIGI